MRLHRIESTQFLPMPLDETWQFFSDPSKLPEITPPWLGLRPTSELPSAMYPGLIVTYNIAPFPGVRVLWVTEITQVVDRTFFVDEQRSGPYKFWHHQHHFREAPGGTEMRDIIHYALPFGVAGDLAGRRPVRRKLEGIFQYRREALLRLFGPARVQRRPATAPAVPAEQA
jgi:ligand-binding SRPBCC domain-containing protein